MLRSSALICIILIFCLSGCLESEAQTDAVGGSRIDTCSGMIEYLQRLQLPAMEGVGVWENKYGAGLKLSTKHYEVFTTLLEPLMLSQVPGFVESSYRGYNKQLPRPVETESKFKMYLFAERGQWEDFTEGFAGKQAGLYRKIKAGAYYLKGACVAYNIGRERTFSILGHEGWHQFSKRYFKFRLPSWLDEGVAMMFEANRYAQGLFYFEPARNMHRLGALKKTLMKNEVIPLKELIAMNPGEAIVKSDSATMAFYSQSYALVRFLKEDDYGKRLSNYHQMMMGGLTGNWPLSEEGKRIAADRNIPLTVGWNRYVGRKLFEDYIGDDFGEIEKEYLTFCRKIVYHVQFK